MSIAIVSKAHIDVLINTAVQLDLIAIHPDSQKMGTRLWKENHRSYNNRYATSRTVPRYTPNIVVPAAFHPVVVLKALTCYELQLAALRDRRRSEVVAWCAVLREALEQLLAPRERVPVRGQAGVLVPSFTESPLYRNAPWFVERLTDVFAT